MSDDQLDRLRYPVGRFEGRSDLTSEERLALVEELERLPAQVRAAVSGLDADQLDRPYRAGGWAIRQVVHHLPDSHMNAYIRFKKAATEDEPVIVAYDEAAWAELADAAGDDVEPSLALLDGLHRRWGLFLRSLRDPDFYRVYVHPELGRVTLGTALQLYAWHGRHHLAHIMNALTTLRSVPAGGTLPR
jgi:uncharacterized damage-inducible protein DinB